MPTGYIDHVDTLDSTEKGGVIRSLTRLARVVGLGSTDYGVLWTSLELAGIPKVPSTLPGTGFEMLLLDERKAKVKDDPGCVDVTLTYNHKLDIQEFGSGQNIYCKIRGSVQQKTTNFYRDWSKPGNPITQIVVAHTFPKKKVLGTLKTVNKDGKIDTKEIAIPGDPDFPGKTFVQGGEVSVAMPQQNIQMCGYLTTPSAPDLVNSLLATVNKNTWFSQGPLEWMCTEAQCEIVGGQRYKFNFEFQHNPDTWEPFAVFKDERTHHPPPNLVPGVGWVQVPYHKMVDYNTFFGALFEGFQQIG